MGHPRRRLLKGVLGVAGLALAAGCGDAAGAVPTASPVPGNPGPGAAPSPSPGVGLAAPGPVATTVQIVVSPAPQAAPPLLVPGRSPSPTGSPGAGAVPPVSPSAQASPSPLPVSLGRPGWIAVSDGGRIVLVDPTGQHAPRTIVDGPDNGEPRWSPDGQRLVIVGGRGPAAELYVQAVGGGPPLRLTSNARPEHGAVWSPRGDRIAYALPRALGPDGAPDPAEPEEIWLLTVATGAAVKIADGFDPSWSPDGQRLVYVTNGQRGPQGARGNAIHTLGADGPGDQQVLALADLPADLLPAYGLPFKPGTVRLRAPSWSPDGTRLVASADGHTSMALTFAAHGPDRDIRPWALAYEGGVGRARWSPDGQRLAVESLPATGVAVVVLADLPAHHEVPLGGPSAGFQASAPTWAADGRSLALIAAGLPARRGAGHDTSLRVFGVDGAARATLLTAPGLGDPDWGQSP